MTVTKILEQTLSAGATSVSFTDADIPNSLIRLYSSNSDIIPVSRILSGNTLTVTYEAQSTAIDVAVEIVKAGLDIVDNVTSTDADKALSAKQGKTLKDAIDTTAGNLSDLVTVVNNLDVIDLDDVTVSDIQSGQVLAWDGTKFVNTDISSGQIYSYNERQIGIWVDNKPLYQRTFHYSGTSDSADFQVTIATLDATIEMKQILNSGLYRGGSLFSPTIYAPSDIYYRYIYNPSDYTLGLRIGGSLNVVVEAYVTVLYTKTTD